MFCRGDGGGIALMMACIGGGGGIGIVFAVLDIGVGGGGDGGGGRDGNILVVLCVVMGGGGGGGIGILGTSTNFVNDDGTVLSPPRIDSVASAYGDGGGGGGGIKDAVIEIDLPLENASGGNGGDNGVGYGARSSLGAFT